MTAGALTTLFLVAGAYDLHGGAIGFADSPRPCANGTVALPGRHCPVHAMTFIIFFDQGSAEITSQAAEILDSASQQHREYSNPQVTISGHTDRAGRDAYNLRLSGRRAEAVRRFLAGRGIGHSAVRNETFGERRPLVETPDGVAHWQNRRVEIKFEERARR